MNKEQLCKVENNKYILELDYDYSPVDPLELDEWNFQIMLDYSNDRDSIINSALDLLKTQNGLNCSLENKEVGFKYLLPILQEYFHVQPIYSDDTYIATHGRNENCLGFLYKSIEINDDSYTKFCEETRSFLKQYNAYLNNNVYSYTLYDKHYDTTLKKTKIKTLISVCGIHANSKEDLIDKIRISTNLSPFDWLTINLLLQNTELNY